MSGMVRDDRPFPIQGGAYPDPIRPAYYPACTIPWWLAEEAYKVYSAKYGTQQSLERLAERGGFGREELVWLLRGASGHEREKEVRNARRKEVRKHDV